MIVFSRRGHVSTWTRPAVLSVTPPPPPPRRPLATTRRPRPRPRHVSAVQPKLMAQLCILPFAGAVSYRSLEPLCDTSTERRLSHGADRLALALTSAALQTACCT